MTAKNQRSITGNFGGEMDGQMMERAQQDAQRVERISKEINRGSFLGLGENKPVLLSEQNIHIKKGGLTVQENPMGG